jgi:Dolichyl-phosphate-mannose-protein mannosyltransferase
MHARIPPPAVFLNVLAIAGVFVLALVLRIPSLYEPRWYRDEGIFAAIASDVRHGNVLYADAWDNKPPLIFYTYAAVQWLFGNGVFALHAVTTVVVLVTLALVMLIALRLYGRMSGAVAGFVFALVTCTPVIEGNLALTEPFMILPTTSAVLLFVIGLGRDEDRRWPWILGSGLLLGIAANYKQVAAFDALAIATMMWLVYKHPVRPVLLLCGGFALPHLLFGAYFAAAGAWSDYWYAVAGSLPLYNEIGDERSPVLRFASYVPALLVTTWLITRRREAQPLDSRYFPPLWLAFAIAGATASTLPFPHYLLQAAPAFALTVVAAPHLVTGATLSRLSMTVAAGVAIGVVLGQFGPAIHERRQMHPLAYYGNYSDHRYGDRDEQQYETFFDGSVESVRDISADIRADGAGDTVYAWSELPWLFAACDVQNPSRYYTSFLGELIPDAKPQVLEDLNARPPAYIVVSDEAYAPFTELEAWMRGRYTLLRQQNDWRLYRQTSLEGKLEPAETSADVQSP